MKRLFGLRLMICSFLFAPAYGQNTGDILSVSDFEIKAQQAGIDINRIKQQSSLSRYEVTKLMNAIECTNCIIPSQEIIRHYSESFWKKFAILPTNDVNDILYRQARYQGESYYYCVATVIHNDYMHGYPMMTSPTCPGQFCGAKSITKGEFAQVLINILGKYIGHTYTTNWVKMKATLLNQQNNRYITNTFNTTDYQLIDQKIEQCGDTECTIGEKHFRTYLKYCMHNLAQCDMRARGRMGEGYWPIAQLNILYKEGILSESQDFINTIHAPMDGKTAIETLARVFPKTACTFDNDYDCDGRFNHQDNCPYDYNPHQTDRDGDGIGDVCDDDIDADGIKNPKNIVDDTGIINTRLLNNQGDNCPLNSNPAQEDKNKNGIGDNCESTELEGVRIETKIIGENTNKRLIGQVLVDYTPVEDDREWNIQGKTYYGKTINIPLTKSGLYRIDVKSTKDSRRKASNTIVASLEIPHTDLRMDINTTKDGLPTLLEIIGITKSPQTIERTIQGPQPSETKKQQSGQKVIFRIGQAGKYTVSGVIRHNDKIIAMTTKDIIISNDQHEIHPVQITENVTNTKTPVNISTSTSELAEWKVNRGDKTPVTSSRSEQRFTHTYTKPGRYIVQISLQLLDGTMLSDTKTIIIEDDKKVATGGDKTLDIMPSQLKGTTSNPFGFKTVRNGYNPQSILNRSYPTTHLLNPDTLSYTTAGIYYPQFYETTDICSSPAWEATIVVHDTKQRTCQEMHANRIIIRDMDNDGIDDSCDDDIDNDTVKNLLGFIHYTDEFIETYNKASDDEKKKLLTQVRSQIPSYNQTITGSNNRPITVYKYTEEVYQPHFLGSCRLDNCPLTANRDQKSSQKRNVGDVCVSRHNTTTGDMITTPNKKKNQTEPLCSGQNCAKDTDQDSVADDQDRCPLVKETINGYLDQDGCPELGADNICGDLPVGGPSLSTTCMMCPCQYANEASDLLKGDTIRTTLRSLSGNILQTRSNELRL